MANDPLIEAQLDRIHRLLTAVDEQFAAYRTELQSQHEQKEIILQEQWRNRREMTTLRHLKKDYDALYEADATHKQKQADMQNHLAELQRLIKAFRAAVKPA